MTGILLIQLGTPDAPTKPALKKYLRQFLGDHRVIEVPRLLWWLILNLFILPTRPKASAAKYARIWDAKTGSPLLHHTKVQTELLQKMFPGVPVRFGMQIGNPPLEDVVNEMIAQGVDRLIALPMYPQYSATTTASATDTLFKALMKVRKVPAIRIVPPYYAHPAYLDAMAALIKDELAKLSWEPEHFVYSFHGIPQKYAQRGDPYATHVVRTTRGLQERLKFPKGKFTQTYQSLFGKDEWLKPYTDDTLGKLAKQGVRKVFVMLPGFTADCLETIDEIGHESLEHFKEAGGEILHQCRCLNDHPAWIQAMKTIIEDEGAGWLPAEKVQLPAVSDRDTSGLSHSAVV
ncbi:ferrochelatase [Zavarzinella formosa]|uniref:ferrochelatase n=1 Tax=Zavarzinella formosa TaxID=360055 RepID=UPI000307EE04|nr:ferrochelatase [Zavarzinella formosa]